jgi:hypothetical protein
MNEDGAERGYGTLYLSVPDADDEVDFIKRLVRGLGASPATTANPRPASPA